MTIKELENKLEDAITIIYEKKGENTETMFDAVCSALDSFKDSIIKYLSENKE